MLWMRCVIIKPKVISFAFAVWMCSAAKFIRVQSRTAEVCAFKLCILSGQILVRVSVCAIETHANNKARKMFIYFSPFRLHLHCFSSSNQANGRSITINATASTHETRAQTRETIENGSNGSGERNECKEEEEEENENKNERVFAKWENSFACAYLLKFESKCECWLVVWCRGTGAAWANICFCVAFFCNQFSLDDARCERVCVCVTTASLVVEGFKYFPPFRPKFDVVFSTALNASRCVASVAESTLNRNRQTDRYLQRIRHDCTHCEIYYIDITISFKLHTR